MLLGACEILASLPLLAMGLVNAFPEEIASWQIISPPDPNYLSLPAPLWITLLFALSGTLLVDGCLRCRRRTGWPAGT